MQKSNESKLLTARKTASARRKSFTLGYITISVDDVETFLYSQLCSLSLRDVDFVSKYAEEDFFKAVAHHKKLQRLSFGTSKTICISPLSRNLKRANSAYLTRLSFENTIASNIALTLLGKALEYRPSIVQLTLFKLRGDLDYTIILRFCRGLSYLQLVLSRGLELGEIFAVSRLLRDARNLWQLIMSEQVDEAQKRFLSGGMAGSIERNKNICFINYQNRITFLNRWPSLR